MHRHSGASRNPGRTSYAPSFRHQPESRAYGHIHRHSGASWNLVRTAIITVIPAPAGIQGVQSYAQSFRRQPASRAYSHMHRHSGASRHPGRAVTYTVIPAPAGIQRRNLPLPSFRRKPESMLAGSITIVSRLRHWIPALAGMTVNMTIRPRACGHISLAQMAKARIWQIARYAAAVFA